MDKLLLVDGNSLLYRAYFAFGGGGVSLSHDGRPTHATYGFLNMLTRAIVDITPTHLAVCFDMRGKTFRHDLYSDYKATRKPTPEDLIAQLADTREILSELGIAVVQKQGFEADDLIGALSKRMPSIILTADKDAFQLIRDGVELALTKSGVTTLDIWNESRVTREIGLTPTQMIDLKAIMGDASDNIPGAKGIGEKGATALVTQFGNVAKIYENLDSIKGALKQKLQDSESQVMLSLQLAKINCDVEIDTSLQNMQLRFPFDNTLKPVFASRGFNSLVNKKGIWLSSNGQPQVAPTEILCRDDLWSSVKQLQKSNHIAIHWDKDFVYVANEQVEFKIRILQNLFDGGLEEGEIWRELDSILRGSASKFVWDSKALKERGIAISNVVLDAKIALHLLNSKAEITGANELLRAGLMEKLVALSLKKLYKDVELPLVDVLVEMQGHGVALDLAALQKASVEFRAQIEEKTQEIYKISGEQFNINSPKAMGEILFKKLGLQVIEKTKTGEFSTNEEVLLKLRGKHPIIEPILRYRKLSKLHSTYVQGYMRLVDENGFVWTRFNNTGTVTGRLSSSEPNLQNIPARSEESRRIRQLFKSRFVGGKLLCADYSQIELRILAHLSGDEVMTKAFAEGRDIHEETARVVGIDRASAKAVNFGIIYGMSSFGLSESLGVRPAEAAKFIERYFAQFPKIKAFLDGCIEHANLHGYVSTIMGRRRYFPELHSKNPNLVKFAHRAATNMPMQGSAADFIKVAMIEISARLKRENKRALLIAQIHDELVLDCPPDEIDEVSRLVKIEMERVGEMLTVPLDVDVEARETL